MSQQLRSAKINFGKVLKESSYGSDQWVIGRFRNKFSKTGQPERNLATNVRCPSRTHDPNEEA